MSTGEDPILIYNTKHLSLYSNLMLEIYDNNGNFISELTKLEIIELGEIIQNEIEKVENAKSNKNII